ncbi:major facilitator superfamily domain-containing protein [Apiospora kogelbergensis]|uniref:major facilitator superfamily domain-containing protein n=1 Tax=Apiospora kogelbergensis TaxID=1337665 RepID=UPI0031319D02
MDTILRPVRWFYHEFGIVSIHDSGRNAWIIILARACRMFAHGAISLILAIYFAALEFTDHQIGLFMTLTLLGDVFLGTFLTLIADRVGRRKVLLGGSFLMIFSGVIFATFENFWILLFAAVVGVVSVTGGDFGPFRSIEESVISQLTTPSTRSDVLSWYVAISTLGSSLGSEAGGRIVSTLREQRDWTLINAYHALFWLYVGMGTVNVILAALLTDACELRQKDDYTPIPQGEQQEAADRGTAAIQIPAASTLLSPPVPQNWLRRSATWLSDRLSQISVPTRRVMYKLWILLALDSVADGMVPYSWTTYYMDEFFRPSKSTLGDVTSAAYFLGAISAMFAGPLARRIGLVNTMVFTHVPSSAAVLLFPLPNVFWMTVALLLVRSALNPLDQAPRTALIAAVVRPEERTAVMGITSLVRTCAAMIGPTLTGLLAANKQFWVAFVVAGIARLSYDFGLYAMFINIKLHQHETQPGSSTLDGQVDEEQPVELERVSLSSDDSGFLEISTRKKRTEGGASTLLQLPIQNERVRSRSPHRSSMLET